jgi:branched-chain amino acid transport system permease protein
MQVLLNGLIGGLAVAVLAVAFQAVYLPTRVFFMGLAGLYASGPYAFSWLRDAGVPVALCAAGALAAVTALAVAAELANHRPLSEREASSGAHLISSLGIYIVIVQALVAVWGNSTRSLRPGVDTPFHIGSVVLTESQALSAVVSIAALGIALLLLHSSTLGLRLRALADNPSLFALCGYDVRMHRLIAFVLGGALAAVASLTSAWQIGYDPQTGLHATLLAVVAVMIGGRTSFVGPMAGGMLLGIVRVQVSWFWDARWQEAVTFALLAFCLLFRPEGLLGDRSRLEAVR